MVLFLLLVHPPGKEAKLEAPPQGVFAWEKSWRSKTGAFPQVGGIFRANKLLLGDIMFFSLQKHHLSGLLANSGSLCLAAS
jgi:hypothetical protein